MRLWGTHSAHQAPHRAAPPPPPRTTSPGILSLDSLDKASTAAESETLRKLRRACANTAHLAVVCLSDQNLLELCHIVVYVFKPVREWHADQSVRLRSSSACREWHTQQASGAGFAVMRSLLQRMKTHEPPAHMGITGGGDKLPSGFSPQHPIVLNENKLCEQVATLTLNLVARRLASHMVHSHGLPCAFAGLLDPEVRPRLLGWLQEVYTAWTVVKQQGGRCWQKVVQRSPFNHIVVQKANCWASAHRGLWASGTPVGTPATTLGGPAAPVSLCCPPSSGT